MKYIFPPESLVYPEYIEDSRRILEIARKHNADINLLQAERLWIKYSDSVSASWIILDSYDEHIWANIVPYLEEVHENE